ncbi:MFS transporter [Putridiphycobacter roseus]|uniref:MFS transporter n=1 Tax=Putridiphycobacter roseus TaxID=2219161 RepID=A0A2W1N0U1_9FLAO|nr:MFS transporter [Putridiphycobacter roseus]PZE16581.1 MFS transporter [Putridiphycobacter roseus]
MKTLFTTYINSFKGLNRAVWWLALITLINRAGTMVIPFMSLYLTEDLCFDLKQVGWVMSAFGAGSVIGSWLGGQLTDKIGYYKVMFISLLLSGFMFVGLQYLQTFESLCLGIFALMIIADMFRPAMFVALGAYSKPENRTRSLTLIRLAINLGFSAGPAVGGLIILTFGYPGLFWIDGFTCAIAGLLLINVLSPKKAKANPEVKVENPQSAYKDGLFWLFVVSLFLFAFVFLQYFSTVPLYYKDSFGMTEFEIGLILGANGFLIFIFEMPLIKWLESSKYNKEWLIFIGAFFTMLSFLVLNISPWIGFVFIGMLFMTVGEMVAFPFANAFAMERAKKGNQGQYMAFFSISFSFAHIFGHNAGMQLIDNFGYFNTWNVMVVIALLTMLLVYILMKKKQKENSIT